MSDDHTEIDPPRRSLITSVPLTAAGVALGGAGAAAQTAQGRAAPGRRLLGGLEVSELGLGVQNMHRTFHTIVPDRDDMIALIRSAFDEGVTFFDCSEAYV